MGTKITMNLLNPSDVLNTRRSFRNVPSMLVPVSRSASPLMRRTSQTSRGIKMEIGSSSRSTLVMKKSRGCSSCGGAR